MMKNIYLFLFFNLMVLNAQETLLEGTIELKDSTLENIYIINLTNKKTAISNKEGKFSIMASENDLLVFSAIHIDYWRQSVNIDNINKKKITVRLTTKIEVLDEVIVEKKPELDAKEMGIIDYTPKKYSKVERRIRAANSGPIDIIVSWLSGRNKMLAKELAIEKKEKYQEKLTSYFNREYFTNTLKIPEIYVDGFVFYVVEEPEIIDALQDKDQLKCKFILRASLKTHFFI